MGLVSKYNVKTLKADTTHDAPEVEKFLVELGNINKQIPYLVIYPPDGRKPIILNGPILQSDVTKALQEAGPSLRVKRTAMTE
jgi:thiol:disulfide interchange protein